MEISKTNIEKAQTTTAKQQNGNTANREYLLNVVNTLTEYSIKENKPLFYLHQIKAVIRNEVTSRQQQFNTLSKNEKNLSAKDKETLRTLTTEGTNPLHIDATDTRLPQIREQLYSLSANNSDIKRKVAYKGTKQKIVIIYNSQILENHAKTNTYAKTLLEQVNKLKSL